MQNLQCDLCVIGAGSGGLSVAAGASQMGADVVLIEKGEMGGDCLNSGCVPSKSLIAAAHAAHGIRRAARFGIHGGEPVVDWLKVHDHIHGVINDIAPHDSQERFESLGCRVIRESARFIDAKTVQAGDVTIRARRFVVATGSRPATPKIPGLESVPYFTNETIFDNRQELEHLVVIGGGPIAVELAQSFRRLGVKVTLLVRSGLLKKDDPELVEIYKDRLIEEGIILHQGLSFDGVDGQQGEIKLEITHQAQGNKETIEGSHLLIATGRRPNLESLNLEAADVHYGQKGIEVDQRLRSSNKKILAIGDVIGHHLFTHMAGYHAGVVIRNTLFHLPAKIDYRAVPWVTYGDPELAHVGMGEAEAKARGVWVETLRKPLKENDRARAEGEQEGLIKVVLGKKGLILGVEILAPHAGELLMPWILAIQNKLRIGAMVSGIVPYPTMSELNKGVAGQFFTPKLYSARMRRVVRFLQKFA
uniref:Putative mercuric reductase n=1 Tax=Magnetococcus massalia (strain MO-1) TaxID=451514 RepID=A0A1S7LP03_MAGMO|nr:Putative mercuric reductase [Candidatus Magnetococcus massalia]